MEFGLGLKRDDINMKIAHVERTMVGEEFPADTQAAGGGRGLITPGYAPTGAMITRQALAGLTRF